MYNPHTETLAYKYNGQAKQAEWFVVRNKYSAFLNQRKPCLQNSNTRFSVFSWSPTSPVLLLFWILKCLASALWSSNYLQEPYCEIRTNRTHPEVPGPFLCVESMHSGSLCLLGLDVHISSDLEWGGKIYSDFLLLLLVKNNFYFIFKWSIVDLQYCVSGVWQGESAALKDIATVL